MRLSLLVPLLAALAPAACADRPAPPPPQAAGTLPYRLGEPDAVLPLPAVLQEISGLTILPSGRLGAVQDEQGTVYEVDPATGDVVGRQPFRGSGDFEGLELAGDAVWALRSDGDLFRIYRTPDGRVASDKVETALSAKNDTEGLAYDRVGHRLLIACKEDPGPGLEGVRTVWAFDLATQTLSAGPVVTLDRADVDGEAPFKPSALAVDPLSGRLYILSSVRKALAVVAPDGTLEAVHPLSARLFPQPEGITFDAAGTLFIANEGPTGAGTLLRFSPTDA